MSRENPLAEESLGMRALGIIRRRALLAIVTFATVFAAAAAFAIYLPDLYRAQATVLVERPLGEGVVRPTIGNELEARLHVIQQTILSRDRLTALIKRFDLYQELRQKGTMEDALTQARQDIEWRPNGPEQVSGRSKTVTFTLTYTGDDREKVSEVTNTVAGFYVESNDQMRSQAAQSATHFMKVQLDQSVKEVDDAERKLRAFVAANQSLLPQAAGVNAATYTRLSDDLRSNINEQARVADAKERLEDTLSEAARVAQAASPTVAATAALGIEPSKELTDLTGRLDKARASLTEMIRAGKGELHPDVKTQREAIVQLERDVEVQRDKDIAAFKAREAEAAQSGEPRVDVARAMPRGTRSVESYQQDLDRLKKQESEIRAQMNGLIAKFDTAPGVQQEYLLVQRDYQAAKDNYDVALRKYEEAKLAEGVETSGQGERFRLLETAIPPDGPSAPNRIRLLILGLLLGLAAAGGIVVAAEQFDTSFHDIDQLREFTSVPVLASIPELGPRTGRSYVRMAFGTVSAVAAIILVGTLSAYIANGNEALVRMLQRAG